MTHRGAAARHQQRCIPSGRTRGQQGQSLLEALIALVLAGTVIVIIALGLQTSATTDGQTNRQQRANTALGTLSDAVREADYLACDGGVTAACPNDLTAAGGISGNARAYTQVLTGLIAGDAARERAVDGVTWRVVGVKYWQPVSFASDGTPSGGGTFTTTFNPVSDAQLLTIEADLGGTKMRSEVVKRFPGALSRFN